MASQENGGAELEVIGNPSYEQKEPEKEVNRQEERIRGLKEDNYRLRRQLDDLQSRFWDLERKLISTREVRDAKHKRTQALV